MLLLPRLVERLVLEFAVPLVLEFAVRLVLVFAEPRGLVCVFRVLVPLPFVWWLTGREIAVAERC